MKKLYLVRHAKSSWDSNKIKDIDRPLNKRGEKDAPVMGKLMKKKEIKPELIMTSPARRALKTAQIFCTEMDIPLNEIIEEPGLYNAGSKAILNIIRQFENGNGSAMIFAHNPGLSELASYLTSGNINDLPTCSIAALNCETDTWNDVDRDKCKLDFFEYPKKI